MTSRRLLLGATILSLLVGALGVSLYLYQRIARCAAVPLLADELLPNADLAEPGEVSGLPAGWVRRTGGAQLRGPAVDGTGFDTDGDGRAMQLLGVANYLQTPQVAVRPGVTYCFSGLALTDSELRSPIRVRLVFTWRDPAGEPIAEEVGLWEPVVLWTPEAPPRDWSPLRAASTAPAGAASLTVRIEPSAGGRIYLDAMHVRQGGDELLGRLQPVELFPKPFEWPLGGIGKPQGGLILAPWPNGAQAAVTFSFDWETAMGGLIHSYSAGDPLADEDYLLRAMRMREGVTTTLALFEPYGVRASYFANGYNFLDGNLERRLFMGNPIFAWASPENGWSSDRWTKTPWFADDPNGTVASHPEWYFGDLIEPLRAAGHEIQSHTFSHFFGGYVDAVTWREDLAAWNTVAAEAGVPPARAIAFPWSSSAGMSDASWDELERVGITAVTRLSDQAPNDLFGEDERGLKQDPRCRWLPGRERRILACPDFYLTEQSADLALEQIERALAVAGMIDLWAHTEEVVTPAQIAAWERVVSRVAADERIWVAPFTEVADWQAAIEQVQLTHLPSRIDERGRPNNVVRVTNTSDRDLVGLSLFVHRQNPRVDIAGEEQDWVPSYALEWGLITIDLAAGQSVEVTTWLR